MYFVNPQIALYGTQIIFNETAGDISNHTNYIPLESLPVTGCLLLVGDVVGFFYMLKENLYFFLDISESNNPRSSSMLLV